MVTTKDIISNIPYLQSYVLIEKLGESLLSQVYRGYHKLRPDQPLVLKLLKAHSDSHNRLFYLQEKVERLKVFHDPRALMPTAIDLDSGIQIIVNPWFAGHSLTDWMAERKKINLADFFIIACNLTDTLEAVHEAGITHGGIKPNNILVQQNTLTVHFTDFITPLDIRNVSHFIYNPEFVRNTLAYTSPEQTGRINYRVDFSTDLYSLGIVFYELLTGKLPFFYTDPLELIHSHLAEDIPKAHQSNHKIPTQLSKIVQKLVSKQPEKRYQSTYGLLVDLVRCRDEFNATGGCTEFTVGSCDRTKRIIFISKMVGRHAQCELIQREYDEVIYGNFRSVFISGLSGIGKTRLIQELQKPLIQHRGYFTSGKFDQYHKNIPYSSLIQALRNLVRIFLTESDAQVTHWQTRIINTLGNLGRVIIQVVPELEFIIGVQPEVAPLPPVEARNRFNNLLGNFLICLADAEHPLVLFIDDLQWCDTATFDFLQSIFVNQQEHPFLFFLGAYRHNEVDAEHPLIKLINATRQRKDPLQEIRLEALGEDDCHEMVAYILDSSLKNTASLSEFIASLTEGNPLFVSESLAWLYDENLLYTDEQQHWQWDINKIRDTKMPASVVELFSAKIRALPSATLHILDYCACLGNRFSAADVALILDINLAQLFENLKPTLRLGMLLEHKYELQFVHDRVQEAVLRQVDEQLRLNIHWNIGNRLLDKIPKDNNMEAQDNLFDIVMHLNKGRPADLEAALLYRLADLNFYAGNKAITALASDAANDFFLTAHDTLPPDCWESAYEMTFKIFQKLAKTSLMCGRYEVSEALINQLIKHALSDLDKAETLAEQTTSLSSFGNFNKAIETANRGLAYFDKAIATDSAEARRQMQALMTEIEAQGDVWNTILDMPFTQERKSKLELAFYSELIPDLYMSGLVAQLYLSAAQSTQLCLAGGMDESVIYSFSIMGLNLGEQGKFEAAFRYQDLAHDLCAKYPNTFGATRGMNGIVWCNMHSRSHPKAIADYCLVAIQCGKNCGDLYNAGLSYGPLMWSLLVQGKNLHSVENIVDECLKFSRKNQLPFSIALAEAVMAGWVAPMKLDYQPVAMEETLKRWESENYVAASGSYFVLLGISQFYLGDYEAAATSLAAVERYLQGLTDNVLKRLWFVFRILNRLRLPNIIWADIETEIALLLQKIETWAKLGPLLKPYLAFIHAEIACAKGETRMARNLYLDAIDEAQTQEYILLSGHLFESLSNLLTNPVSMGSDAIYHAETLRLYQACNADSMGHKLHKYNDLSSTNKAWAGLNNSGKVMDLSTLPNLDINYLTKATQELSAELNLGQLLQKILKIGLESSGAQHGYLLSKKQSELFIVAESHVGKKQDTNFKNYSLSLATGISQGIVNYVSRTQEKIVLTDASTDINFQNDPVVQQLSLHSVLCLPIINKSSKKDMLSILYLENRLSPGVFTIENSAMTELLASHAAIALDNAHLIEKIEQTHLQLQNKERVLSESQAIAHIGSWSVDLANNSILFSEEMYKIFGVTHETFDHSIKALIALIHPDDRASLETWIVDCRNGMEPTYLDFRIIASDGIVRHIRGSGGLQYDELQNPLRIVCSSQDISEQKKMDNLLHESEQLWKFAIEGSGDGVWDWNIQTDKALYSKRWKEMLGYSEDDILPTNQEWLTRIHHDDQSYVAKTMQAYLNGETAIYVVEYRLKCKDASYKWILGRGMVVSRSEDDKPLRMIGTHTDITLRKQAEEDLRIAATAFESQEGMMVTDANKNIIRVNNALTQITGYTAEELIGKNPRILQSGRHDANFYATIWESIDSTGTWQGEIWNQRKNGEIYPENLTITAVKDKDSIISNYVATVSDITLKKAAVDKIERLAFYDPLTDLPNRRLLLDRLKPALASSHRSGRQGALLFIDIDNFKMLNDTLGHGMGDLLLQQVAQRLQSSVREGDTVARLGGDEFVVMLEDLSELALEAATQTEMIGHNILAILNLSYQLAMHEYHSTPSIGAILFNGQKQSSDELLKQADIAMYQAKASGRNALRFFDPKMQASINARATLEEDLRQALLGDQFILYYQPQVHHNGKIIGAEVLIRWQHPLHGLVLPAEFIPLAEETGLILAIGQWVMETACKQIKIWETNEHAQHLQLAVNVSSRQFYQTDFIEQVLLILNQNAISPDKLKLELTESLVLDDIDDTIFKMKELRKIGVRFSMDDFGTGYSSLSSLKKLPLDQLKIDQSFVRDISIHQDDTIIVETIIVMAKKLKIEVIAEGVETEDQRVFLEQHDCQLFQGYLFSKPVPIEQFEWLLKKNSF